MKFKKEYTLEQRTSESDRILVKYPDRFPIICEKIDNSSIMEIDKKKYLIPGDLTCGQFAYVIRKRIKLPPEQAVYLFVNGVIPAMSCLISSLYHEYKDTDGFLYVTYASENTFGYV